jgi:hypothetical protein
MVPKWYAKYSYGMERLDRLKIRNVLEKEFYSSLHGFYPFPQSS